MCQPTSIPLDAYRLSLQTVFLSDIVELIMGSLSVDDSKEPGIGELSGPWAFDMG
jgi:hypothetical protein